MVKNILLIVSVLLLSSCENFMMLDEYDYPDIPNGVTDLRSAFEYVSSMEYKSDIEAHGQIDFWQAMRDTEDRRAGDCEDFASCFSALATQLGYDAEVLIVYNSGCVHSVSRINGVIYDPSPVLTENGYEHCEFIADNTNWEILNVFTVDEYMNRAIRLYDTY